MAHNTPLPLGAHDITHTPLPLVLLLARLLSGGPLRLLLLLLLPLPPGRLPLLAQHTGRVVLLCAGRIRLRAEPVADDLQRPHPGRLLGRRGLGRLLELGPERDLGFNSLVSIRNIFTHENIKILARKKTCLHSYIRLCNSLDLLPRG